MQLIVNDATMSPPSEAVTWGDLLDWLETEHLKPGQCITRVEFQGREQIHYRQAAICDQDIESVGTIVVESGEFDSVVRESFGELQTEIRSALESTRDIISLLENRNEERAYNQLTQLLESIRIFYSLFSEDLGWEGAEDAERVRQTATLENAIRQLITAQENRFWVSICDVLEYEITPILESWQTTVEKTLARVN